MQVSRAFHFSTWKLPHLQRELPRSPGIRDLARPPASVHAQSSLSFPPFHRRDTRASMEVNGGDPTPPPPTGPSASEKASCAAAGRGRELLLLRTVQQGDACDGEAIVGEGAAHPASSPRRCPWQLVCSGRKTEKTVY